MNEYLPVSEQVRLLFEVVTHPEGHPYTMQEVSEQIDVSLATISQLRSGRIKNPQLNTLRELCRFFRVPLRYFETQSVEECYAILSESEPPTTPEMNEIAFRATQLSRSAQKDVLTIIKWVQAAERQRRENAALPPLPNLEEEEDES